MAKRWRPRSSAVGGYIKCSLRAAMDKAIHEGLIESTREDFSSPYADLGTVIHWHMQVMAGAKFTGPAAKHKYTEEQAANARTLLRNGADLVEHAERVAEQALQRLPPLPEGVYWHAERAYKRSYLTGHLDFLSSDGKIVVDLKTTSRVPYENRPKMTHVWQQVAYALMEERVEVAYVLYAHSMGNWVMPSHPVFLRNLPDDTGDSELLANLATAIRMWRSKKLYDIAFPNPGPHCRDDFCPYQAECSQVLLPQAATVYDTTPPPPQMDEGMLDGLFNGLPAN